MKRIWFTQQKQYNYIPMRLGLGYIEDAEVINQNRRYVPKIYTTRLHPLFGEYYVVEGSRFKAVPLNPKIEFKVTSNALLNLSEGLVCPIHNGKPDYESWECVEILDKDDLTFAELDLGYKGATYSDLRNELIHLNPRVTIDTRFYVNLLERVERCVVEEKS